jgi:TrmH family RNA methyltransferase
MNVTGSFHIILVRPENPENIGLVARAMKNTGFFHLRLTGRRSVPLKSFRTAVHAADILRAAAVFSALPAATADLQVVFAATAKARKNFSPLSFDEAVSKMLSFGPDVKIGLLFGNERTGLSSEELGAANFLLTIPQASRQPSYNLASAVLISLFEIFRRLRGERPDFGIKSGKAPLSRKEQEECIHLVLKKLEERSFIHSTNRRHVTEKVSDLLGRLAMTDSDRKLLLALFSHAGLGRAAAAPRKRTDRAGRTAAG